MGKNLLKRKACESCKTGGCATCPVLSTAMIETINQLNNRLEAVEHKLKIKTNENKELKKENKQLKETKTIFGFVQPKPKETYESWLAEMEHYVVEMIKSYKLDISVSSVFKTAEHRLKEVYGFVKEQERKDQKEKHLYSDDKRVNIKEIIFNSNYKDLFSNSVHTYIHELTKDKIPDVNYKFDPSEKVDVKKREYNKKDKEAVSRLNSYKESLLVVSEITGQSNRYLGREILNLYRAASEDYAADIHNICSDIDQYEILSNCVELLSDNYRDIYDNTHGKGRSIDDKRSMEYLNHLYHSRY